jgi:hypothetical protein
MAPPQETWFRGEGVGVAPAKPGGHIHDFGDGMYLTDSEDVAAVYAQRRAKSPADQRVWMVTVDRQSLGRVLDLTTDHRWQSFMTDTKDKMLLGKSRISYLKIKQELYGQFFEEFLSKNKINITAFDAVIGPEYNLGGKQLCILHKNGVPTKLSSRLRALFRPSTSVVRWEKTPGTNQSVMVVEIEVPPGGGKIRFLKGVGGFVLSVGVTTLLLYLFGKLMASITEKQYQAILERELRDLDPEIQKGIDACKRRVFEILRSGQHAYANVKVAVWYFITTSADDGPGSATSIQSIPAVKLIWVNVYDYKRDDPGKEKEHDNFMHNVETHIVPYILTSELTIPQEEVDRYSAAIEELEWYDSTLNNPNLSPPDVTRLRDERRALDEKVRKVYGEPVDSDTSIVDSMPITVP